MNLWSNIDLKSGVRLDLGKGDPWVVANQAQACMLGLFAVPEIELAQIGDQIAGPTAVPAVAMVSHAGEKV